MTISMNGRQLEHSTAALGQSGGGISAVNGLRYSTQAHVVGGAIVMSEETDTFRAMTTIKTDGKSSCSASRVYRLKPGQKYFQTATPNGHAPEVNADIHIEGVTCSVAPI